MLSVVKSGQFYKIRNNKKKKTYDTRYHTQASATRKKKIIEKWFNKRARRSWVTIISYGIKDHAKTKQGTTGFSEI